jgi:hypothetical protein
MIEDLKKLITGMKVLDKHSSFFVWSISGKEKKGYDIRQSYKTFFLCH